MIKLINCCVAHISHLVGRSEFLSTQRYKMLFFSHLI